jgi:ferredoxin-NADP reductase
MLRHRQAARSDVPARLLCSSRSYEDVIFRDELDQLRAKGMELEVIHTLTRSKPAGWRGFAPRIDQAMLPEVAGPLDHMPQVFSCGPTLRVEATANGLVQAGVQANRIRTERFGPTGS